MNELERPPATDAFPEPVGPLEPALVEVVGPGATRAPLRVGLFSIGSHAGCDLVVKDRSVSRRHLSVELVPGAVLVRDLQSRNGTFYLGARIETGRVPLGGAVQIGRTTLRFLPQSGGPAASAREELHGLSGRSLAMRRLFSAMEKVGPTDSSVLVYGESGAGKERVARALHALSRRSTGPLVIFDCGAVSRELIHAELFGHARGAFTGATDARRGAIEAAAGGTLLLDHVGLLPLELQPVLLRVLERHESQRLGEGVTRRSDFRLIATVDLDLEAEARAGRFRSDLYYRLAVAVLEVPPLRSRPEDIPVLAAVFAREIAGFEVQLASTTLALLQCNPWPGNVRELRNAIERAVALDGAGAPTPPTPEDRSFKKLLGRFEHDFLKALLGRNKRNLSAAAREAKLSRSQLYRLLSRHGLNP